MRCPNSSAAALQHQIAVLRSWSHPAMLVCVVSLRCERSVESSRRPAQQLNCRVSVHMYEQHTECVPIHQSAWRIVPAKAGQCSGSLAPSARWRLYASPKMCTGPRVNCPQRCRSSEVLGALTEFCIFSSTSYGPNEGRISLDSALITGERVPQRARQHHRPDKAIARVGVRRSSPNSLP
jgi:hypothetical protein